MLRRDDTLDYKILKVTNQIFKELPTLELKDGLDQEDINDVLLGIALRKTTVIISSCHISLYRSCLLQRSLDLHDSNPA